MRVVRTFGKENLATVYLAEIANGTVIEFVESLQPPIPREEKWVLIVSTMSGCPVRCLMCDAGGDYRGNLSTDEILAQIDYMISRRFPQRFVPVVKFKIQFARMGEPALNDNVLEVLKILPKRYSAAGLMPCISTVAPYGGHHFFRTLLQIKELVYSGGRFQLQFSIHTTDENLRDRLIPIRKWSLEQIAEYGERFVQDGNRKVTLNFALGTGMPLDTAIIRQLFSPRKFLIKITPINPTYTAIAHGLTSYIDPYGSQKNYEIVGKLRNLDYDVLLSIGEVEENLIGSNCGQYVRRYLKSVRTLEHGYRSEEYRICAATKQSKQTNPQIPSPFS